MRFVRLLIPYDVETIASRADPKVAIDVGYSIKSTLHEVFGDKVVRPWRLVDQSDTHYEVVGWLKAEEDAAGAVARGKSFRIEVSVGEWAPKRNAILVLDMLASPEVTYSNRDAAGRRKTTSKGLPVEGDEAQERLVAWFDRRLSVESSGLGTTSDVTIRSAANARVLLKAGGRPFQATMPRVNAEVEVVVDDVGKFTSFLAAGIGPLKHVGYGAMFPKEVVDGAA